MKKYHRRRYHRRRIDKHARRRPSSSSQSPFTSEAILVRFVLYRLFSLAMSLSNEPHVPIGVIKSGEVMSRPAVSAQAPRTAGSASDEPRTIEPTDRSVYKAAQATYASRYNELALFGKGGLLHGHPKFVCCSTNRPAAHQPQQSGRKAQLLKAQPPKAPPPRVRSKAHVAPSGQPMKVPPPVLRPEAPHGQPMKAPPWGLRPEIPPHIELTPPQAQPKHRPPPTPPAPYHVCRDVGDYLLDSDDDTPTPLSPVKRRIITSPAPKLGSAASAQLGGYLTSPPPKQLPAGRLVQTAGSAYPAGSARMATADQDARGWIYIPPQAVSNAKACPPCMHNLRALCQPVPDGFDHAGFYLRAGVYWMAGVCISCRNAFESFSQPAPAPVTHAPHEQISQEAHHELLVPPPAVPARPEKATERV